MKSYIVRVVRRKWFATDYAGTYRAVSAVAALTIAGNDKYMQKILDRGVVRIEAVEVQS